VDKKIEGTMNPQTEDKIKRLLELFLPYPLRMDKILILIRSEVLEEKSGYAVKDLIRLFNKAGFLRLGSIFMT